MTNIYEKKKILFVVFAFLLCSFSFPAQAQKDASDQIGYLGIEYYTLENLYKNYKKFKIDPTGMMFVRAIYRGVRSAGISPKAISLPRPVLLNSDTPFADDYESTIIPLVQIGQREGQRHIFLNITPTRLLAEAWLLKHPQGPPEVLSISAINTDEFFQLSDDWEEDVQQSYFLRWFFIWRFRSRVPKALVFLPDIFSASARNELIPFFIDISRKVKRCVQNTLPLLEKSVEINLKVLEAKGKSSKAITEAPDLLTHVPECLN